MRVKILLLAALIAALIDLAGCWDYVEYEDMALVFAIGIDYHENSGNVTVTIQYLEPPKGAMKGAEASQPQSTSAGGGAGVVSSCSDITIIDAVNKLQRGIGKRLFYGFMNVFVINEEAARYILNDVVELTDRTPVLRLTANLLVTPGRAQDIISIVDPNSTEASARGINDLVNTSAFSGVAYPVSIQFFEEMLATAGKEAQAPRIVAAVGDQEQNRRQDDKTSTNIGDVSFSIKKMGHSIISGIACFKGEEFAGWLDERESRGLCWIARRDIHTYISVSPSGQGNTRHVLNFFTTRSKSKVKARLENGKPAFDINVNVEAVLRKYSSTNKSTVLTSEVLGAMEKELAGVICSDIEAALEKVQKQFKSDVFNLGFAFFRKHPIIWRKQYKDKWADIFPTVPVTVNVDAHIQNTGNNVLEFEVR